MTYEQVKTLKPTEFKRLCGVYPDTFKDMVTVLKAEKVWQKKTGRPSKLSTEDQLLITLEYWREYPDRGTSQLKSLCSMEYRHRLQKKISHIYHI